MKKWNPKAFPSQCHIFFHLLLLFFPNPSPPFSSKLANKTYPSQHFLFSYALIMIETLNQIVKESTLVLMVCKEINSTWPRNFEAPLHKWKVKCKRCITIKSNDPNHTLKVNYTKFWRTLTEMKSKMQKCITITIQTICWT